MRRFVAALLLVVLCAACGGQSNHGSTLETGPSVIPPAGGSITLDGVATAIFPAGAFPAPQTVRLEATSEARTALVFDISAAWQAAGPRAAQELRINTGSVQPKSDTVEVRLTVPNGLAAPSGSVLAGFVELFEGNDEDVHDVFLALPSSFDAPSRTLAISVPAYAFADSRTPDKTFEAVVVISSAPGAPAAGARRYAAASVAGCPKDVARFRPPLQGPLHVTSGFSSTRNNTAVGISTTGHPAVDLQAAAGDTVVSVGEGTVVDARESNGKSGADDNGGFGGTVLLKMDGVGYVRYAHLEAGSLTVKNGDSVQAGQKIASSGKTGAAAGPHLHLEYKPDSRADRIDPFPCIDAGYEGTFTFSFSSGSQTLFTAKGDLRLDLKRDTADGSQYDARQTSVALTSTYELETASCTVQPPAGYIAAGTLHFYKKDHPGTYILAFGAAWPAIFTCTDKSTGKVSTFGSTLAFDFGPANCDGPVYLPITDESLIKGELTSGCGNSPAVHASWELERLAP